MKVMNAAILLYILLVLSFTGCSRQGKSFVPSIPGYHTDTRQTIVLDKELLEISGMYYLPDTRIAAINDEDGKIFLINSSTGDFTVTKFGRKRDYEDVVVVDSFYYVLESNGNIHRVPVAMANTEEEFEFPREKKIEFESLYYDPNLKQLVLVSKEQRETKKGIITYTFSPDSLQFSDDILYEIRRKEIHEHLKDNNAEFKSSAAAIHPVLNKLFLVASVGKAMLQCSLDGKIEGAWQLNPVQFPQPEGLTFAPNGDMFISNEGADGKATILKFPYTPGK
ncbi:hypothetical protein HB364_03790 [Pseudoflavitalea sp. X16]|uniref:hypothetical protein n=1 Tax=Paraflavitalea devenefica TaxID=2716334 RepID=UPI001422FEBD|nr:hypothetical protein [Paraflavitalea devenefica]NII24183.1 hypothetical protein [Paraflavitalea devenefica]